MTITTPAVIDLSGLLLATPFDLVGLAAMVSQVASPGDLTIIPPTDPGVGNYLQRMDLFRVIPSSVRVMPVLPAELPRFESAPVVELTPVREPHDVDVLADALLPRMRSVVSADAWRALLDIIVELGENATTHGRNPNGAYIAAQYYSGQSSGMSEGFWIGVADSGVGIRQHLTRRAEYAHLKSDTEAIGLATKLWVTGTPERRGIGLQVVREKAGSFAPGEVLIRSGRGEGRFFSRPSGASTARYRHRAYVRGTWVHVRAGGSDSPVDGD